MLNKIWAGLIIISIVFAMGHDIRDELKHSYGNGELLKVSYQPAAGDGQIILHYRGRQLIIPTSPELPKQLQFVADNQPSNDRTQIKADIQAHDASRQQLTFILPEIHWLKLKDITRAAFDMAEFAVKLVLLQPNNYGFSQLVSVPGKARLAGNGPALGKRRNVVQGR